MNNKRQIAALMDEAQSLMRKVNSLIMEANELADEGSNNEKDVLAEYNNKFNTWCSYWYLDGMGDIVESSSDYNYYEISPREYNYFNCFWDLKYAEQSKQLTAFNNKLLAFKWCHDRDYEPDWNDCDEKKYCIYCIRGYYKVDYTTVWQDNHVYFSSEEIAQKCCDWLNSPEGQYA